MKILFKLHMFPCQADDCEVTKLNILLQRMGDKHPKESV